MSHKITNFLEKTFCLISKYKDWILYWLVVLISVGIFFYAKGNADNKPTDLVIAIATLLLGYIALSQLSQTNKTSAADFAHKLKEDFFTNDAQVLFSLFEQDLLIFEKKEISNKHEEYPYFTLNKEKTKHITDVLKENPQIKQIYLANDIDALLLGHIEDLGVLHKQKLLDIESVYEGFALYIEVLHENSELKKYIHWLRNFSSFDAYDYFDQIYQETLRFGNRKEKANK